MGNDVRITPDKTYDTSGTVDSLTLHELDELEAEGAAEDADALLGGQGFDDDEPDPEAEKAWVESGDGSN